MQNKNNADGMPDQPMRLYRATPCECVVFVCVAVWLESVPVLCTVESLRVCVVIIVVDAGIWFVWVCVFIGSETSRQ